MMKLTQAARDDTPGFKKNDVRIDFFILIDTNPWESVNLEGYYFV